MFFVGFAVIVSVWFVSSLIRARDFKSFRLAEMLGLLFVVFAAVFSLGVWADPVDAGAWTASLLGFVIVGFTVALFAAAAFMMKDRNMTSGRRSSDVQTMVNDKAYVSIFMSVVVVTVLVALAARLVG